VWPVRRWTVLVAIGFVFAFAVGSLSVIRLVRHSDTALARWASIANIIGLPLSALMLLVGIIALMMQRSAAKGGGGVGASATITIGVAGQVIVGDIPQEPQAFNKRIELLKRLTKLSSNLQIYTLVGMRGVGKSQLAGAVARKRIAQRWRVIAWLNAENKAYLLADFRQVAIRLGLNRDQLSSDESAMTVRHWLEADGESCLLVLDNAINGDLVRQYIPATGKAQVIVTTDNQELANVGISVPVTEFTADQAIAYMRSRTGLTSLVDADGVVADLNYLPLALAQAASVIAEQRLTYAAYRQRLNAMRVSDYITVTEADPYPMGVAEAILLSVSAAEAHNACRPMLELLALLSQSGVPRTLLYSAAEFMQSEAQKANQPLAVRVEVDESLRLLAKFSLLTWGLEGDSVSLPRLIARVILERADRENTLRAAAQDAVSFIMDAVARQYYLYKPEERRAAVIAILKQGFACVENLAPFHQTLSDFTNEALQDLTSFKFVLDSRDSHYRARSLADSGRFDEAVRLVEEALLNLDGASSLYDPALRARASAQRIRLSAQRVRASAERLLESGMDLLKSDICEVSDLGQRMLALTDLVAHAVECMDDVNGASLPSIAELKRELSADLEHIRRRAEAKSRYRWTSPMRYRRSGRHSNASLAVRPAVKNGEVE
jgi:tetratricopeptide (TPR) repeat protein